SAHFCTCFDQLYWDETMPGVPSNKSCERCKQKHLKCDETRPKCRRCSNAGVECPGYTQLHKFIDQGPTLRRRFAPYKGTNSNPGTASRSDNVRNGTLFSCQLVLNF
ncbi:hypothetical protein N7497_006082, partial [Penicillium chrysogenum]